MASATNDQDSNGLRAPRATSGENDRGNGNQRSSSTTPSAGGKTGRNSNYLKAARNVGYLEISDYAIIGNLRTAAVVGRDSSIDSMCWPYFDSPSIFARILDKDIGGHFSIHPMVEHCHSKQQYLPNSAIIQTKWLADEGVCTITDFMPRPSPNARGDKPLLPWLVRRVEVIRGTLPFRLECFPAFDYARQGHETTLNDDEQASKTRGGKLRKKAVFKAKDMTLELRAVTGHNEEIGLCDQDALEDIGLYIDNKTWPRHKGPGVSADFELTEGQTVDFVLREDPHTSDDVPGVPDHRPYLSSKAPVQERDENKAFIKTPQYKAASYDPLLTQKLAQSLLEATTAYWYTWIQQSKYKGRWREFVHRSAITLKLLTFELTGAIVAAATFSLPEGLNGEGRNWDYRYTWIRDASFTVYALIRLGFTAEATAFMDFIQGRIKTCGKGRPLQIMFGIRGETDMSELELDHLDGYKGQKPVRIGNGAADHLQLDVYGELMDAVYLTSKLAKPCSWELWKNVREIVDYVVDNYDQPDMSIWEVRNAKQNFVYSKIMMWVALDRGLRLADKRSLPCPKRVQWMTARDTLYEEIMEKGWNEEKQYFCQSYENKEALDASVLVMPLVFFISPVDPRWLSTLKAILKTPEKGGLTINHLVYRYDTKKVEDGVGGEEGAFLLCACWAIEALTRAGQHDAKMLAEARTFLEDLLGYANHVGLFSEELSMAGQALGNTPQAFTHVSVISAAFNLDRVLNKIPVGE